MEGACRAVPAERRLARRGINLDRARVGGRHVETAEPLLPLRPHMLGIHYRYIPMADTRRPQSVGLHRPISGCERKKEESALLNALHSGHGVDVLQLGPVHYGSQTVWQALRRGCIRFGSAFDSDGLGDGTKDKTCCSWLLSPSRRAPTYVIRWQPMVISQVESRHKDRRSERRSHRELASGLRELCASSVPSVLSAASKFAPQCTTFHGCGRIAGP